jgi:hypothetical protein
MNIALTGHRQGLGEFLYKTLLDLGHTVTAFDIIDGYDINKKDVREQILLSTKDCEVFINNAYGAPGQFELLRSTIESKQYRHIINVGTHATKVPKDVMDCDPDWLKQSDKEVYMKQKFLQENYIHKFRNKTATLISTINPGYMKTNLIESPTEHSTVDLADVCSAILFQIDLAKKGVCIPDIDIFQVSD